MFAIAFDIQGALSRTPGAKRKVIRDPANEPAASAARSERRKGSDAARLLSLGPGSCSASLHPSGGGRAEDDPLSFGKPCQGSLYVSEVEDLAVLFAAITALKTLLWFAPLMRDIRAFRIEQWSDFTTLVKT